jgi:hypothetical protein
MSWETKHYLLGDSVPQTCGARTLKTLAGTGIELVLSCQRPTGHDGAHVALWLKGVVEWEARE